MKFNIIFFYKIFTIKNIFFTIKYKIILFKKIKNYYFFLYFKKFFNFFLIKKNVFILLKKRKNIKKKIRFLFICY